MAIDPVPLNREVEDLLRRCVECGLCLPHCATWLGTGNEVNSPRGRLVLLRDLLNRPGNEAPQAYLEAFDLCIGCRACETACPSGVPFSLLERGQELAMARLERKPGRSAGVPGGEFLLRHLDSKSFLKTAGKAGGVARRVLAALAGNEWRKKLDSGPAGSLVRLLGTMPTAPGTDSELQLLLDRKCGRERHVCGNSAAVGAKAAKPPGDLEPRVAFFTGCANGGLLSATSRRLVELLTAAGCEVVLPTGQDCCGALASHTGRPGRAAALRRENQAAFAPYLTGRTRILVEAAGCGLEMKEKYEDGLAARISDAVVLLAELDLPPLGEVPLRVAYHDPCHARHGQGIVAEPRQLLRRIPGLELVEPTEPEVCCGSGGAWGLTHPELSARLARRKAADLAATGADLMVTSNPGCLGQIADGLALEDPGLPILPLTDLLWYAWWCANGCAQENVAGSGR